MTLGEKIKEQRQNSKLTQEKVAELAGVSRQAVTKWEADKSAPSTENLLKLAEIFGVSLSALLDINSDGEGTLAEQVYSLYKKEKEKERSDKRNSIKKNIFMALLTAAAYLAVYLAGRLIWCDFSENSFIGWLALVKPSGENSYLYGWLLSSNMFWVSMAISVLPALWGRYKFSFTTFVAFVAGLGLGIIFGPNPDGAAYGQGDYGWAIWGAVYLLSVIAGILLEHFAKKDGASSGAEQPLPK